MTGHLGSPKTGHLGNPKTQRNNVEMHHVFKGSSVEANLQHIIRCWGLVKTGGNVGPGAGPNLALGLLLVSDLPFLLSANPGKGASQRAKKLANSPVDPFAIQLLVLRATVKVSSRRCERSWRDRSMFL